MFGKINENYCSLFTRELTQCKCSKPYSTDIVNRVSEFVIFIFDPDSECTDTQVSWQLASQVYTTEFSKEERVK